MAVHSGGSPLYHRYILDFYGHEKKLAIEVDGDIHINQY